MSADILFLKDIQDVWLFSHFIENGYFQKNHKLYFMIETTAKISAVQNWPGFVKSLGINETNMFAFEGEKSESFKMALEKCRYFITKDFLPFESLTQFSEKLVVLSWVGESTNRAPHGYNKKFAQPGYRKLYCEKILVPVYQHMGFEADEKIPKYYFLNNNSRSDICRMLDLDPEKKYVTVFNNMWFNGDAKTGARDNNLTVRTKEIYDYIISQAQKRGYEIIVKNKMKYDAAKYSAVPGSHYDKYSAGTPSLYHTGISLMAISEFSVGLATAAAIESEHLGTRFISFWKHDPATLGEDLYEDIVSGNGQNYRLAQGKNTFIVNKNDELATIIGSMDTFINNSESGNLRKFPVDKFLEG